jgi:nuclear cap-binding protein subunit 1
MCGHVGFYHNHPTGYGANSFSTVEQPFKIPWIASVILLANARKPEFGAEVIKKIGDVLQKNINEGNWREVKLYLRFLACLQGALSDEGIFPLLEALFQRAVDLQTASSEDALGLELVKIILLTVPYILTSSANGVEHRASSLLDRTEVIALTPSLLEGASDPYPSLQEGSPTSSESALSLLQKHMQEEAKSMWPLSCLPRPWRPTEKAPADEENPLSDAQKQPCPDITLPEVLQLGPRPIFPEVFFSVYSDQEVATVPSAMDTCAILLRDAINDTINALDTNRYTAAKVLIDVDLYFAPKTFVHRGTAFDKMRDVATDGHVQWKPEDVVVDACFANIFQLPGPERKQVYYHSVLTEACRLQPQAVAPSLGRAIRYLYRNVDRMDLELSNRFLDWFAHHLSNFGFTWKWTEWTEDLDLNDLSPKKAFILDSIEKEIRLSFAARIRGTLPPEYATLITKEKEVDTPTPKFEKEGAPFADKAKEVVQLIRKRAPGEEIEPILEQVQTQALENGSDEQEAKAIMIDVLATSIAWVGSKSLSHFLAIVERSKTLLLKLMETEGVQSQMISSVLEFWQHQAGTAATIILKLVNYEVLTPTGIIHWAFNAGVNGGRNLGKVYMWEIVTGVLAKVSNKVLEVVRLARTPGLDEAKRAEIRAVLDVELETLRKLYAEAKLFLKAVQAGNAPSAVVTSEEDGALIRVWAAKWAWVLDRREKVNEMWIRDELAKPIPEPEVVDEKMEEVKVDGNGVEGSAEGNGEVHANGAEAMDAEV